MRRARAGASREAERWLAPILNYDPLALRERRPNNQVQSARIGPLRRRRDRAVDMRADRVVAHRIAPVDQVLLVLVLHPRKAGGDVRERSVRAAGQGSPPFAG